MQKGQRSASDVLVGRPMFSIIYHLCYGEIHIMGTALQKSSCDEKKEITLILKYFVGVQL